MSLFQIYSFKILTKNDFQCLFDIVGCGWIVEEVFDDFVEFCWILSLKLLNKITVPAVE